MKNRILPFTLGFCVTLFALMMGLSGCTAFRNGSPPTAFEQGIFTVTTNYTPVLAVRTNVVTITLLETNVVTQAVTNVVGVVELHTNVIVFPVVNYMTNTVLVTNQEAHYNYTPNSTLTGAEGLVSSIPVYGTLASTALAGLAAIWGWFRSSKNGTAGATLAQGIETMREFVKALPNGSVYDAALTQWLQQHQADTGALNTVLGYLETTVSNSDAQIAAQQIQAAIAALNPSALPPAVAKA